METAHPITIVREMKEELSSIAVNIDIVLYAKLRDVMSIPPQVCEEFGTAQLYFIYQLLNDQLRPWYIAACLRNLGHPMLADNFETFADKHNFTQNEQTQSIDYPPEYQKIATVQLFKKLKSALTQEELLTLRDSRSKTFDNIFSDLLVSGLFTTLLRVEEGKYEFSNKLVYKLDFRNFIHKMKIINREDLAAIVTQYSYIISTMHPVTFSRTVRLCLDTMDDDILSILSELRQSLLMEHSTFHTLDEQEQISSLQCDYIPLTFTSQVDTRTLPLTEGSDAELQTLASNYTMQVENKAPYYVNALEEIYSPSSDGKLICLIGHPGTGKSMFCRKLINMFATGNDDTFRFVLLITCRDSRWHTLEGDNQKNPHLMPEKLEQLLQLFVPIISPEYTIVLTQIILNTNGRGVLLIIDSFDEFPQHFRLDSTLLFLILKRTFLPNCTLLITSRPGAWNQLTRSHGRFFPVHLSWQVLGFSVEQRDQFIEVMLSSPDKRSTCFNFLSTKLELNILSLVPINISLITSLILNTDTIAHIHTLTDLYTSLILFTMDRQLKRVDEQSTGISSLRDMPADLLTEFCKLTELSYEALLKRQITFSSSEFPSIKFPGSKYTMGLGLFHIIRVKTGHLTIIDHLSTPHLTFQEYLAAWHLSHHSTEQLTAIIAQIFMDGVWPAMKVCIRFLLGLLTDGQTDIIQILTDNIHRYTAPLLDIKLTNVKLLNYKSISAYNKLEYNKLYESKTSSHLSLLPYIVETRQSSIIDSYYNLLTPYNSTAPHFFLPDNIPPIEINSLYQFVTLLPPTCSVTVLRVDVTQLNIIQMDMLQKIITCIPIDTLIVKLELTSNNNNRLINFLNNITSKTAIHTPKHICYHFNNINFLENELFTTELIPCISPTATHVIFVHCNYTPDFMELCEYTPDSDIMALLISSLTRLEYLQIYTGTIWRNKLHGKFLSFKLKERKLKGLYLDHVFIQDDSILYEYLQSQSSLQEIHLYYTTYSTLDTLRAIQHLTSLQYIYIQAIDRALNMQSGDNTEESRNLFLNILHKNCYTLSSFDFSAYGDYIPARYTDIMLILSKCPNLQYIDFSGCSLTPLHMPVLGTTINQLHALLWIDMSHKSITDEGIMTLGEVLTPNNSIIIIDLADCGLTTTSIPAVKSIMTKCVKLQRIRLPFSPDSEEYKKLQQFAYQRKLVTNELLI